MSLTWHSRIELQSIYTMNWHSSKKKLCWFFMSFIRESHATAWLCTSLPFCDTSFQLSLLMVNILNYLRKFNLHIAVARCEWANFMSRVPFRFGSPNYRYAKNLHVFSCIFRSLCTFLNWLTLIRHMQFSDKYKVWYFFSLCMHWRRWSSQCIG